jgi:hypothetical protein
MKQVAVDTLKEYGVGTCGPSGFYGTIGMSLLLFLRLSPFGAVLVIKYTTFKASSQNQNRPTHHPLLFCRFYIILAGRDGYFTYLSSLAWSDRPLSSLLGLLLLSMPDPLLLSLALPGLLLASRLAR